jgi:hypothetical protein
MVMEISFVIAVALGVAVVVVLLILIAVIVYQRWRISDNNAHIKAFIDEILEMRGRLHDYKHTGQARVLQLNDDELDVAAAAGVEKNNTINNNPKN